MVYYATNAPTPASVAGGPRTYINPYVPQCGCGSAARASCGVPSADIPAREGFRAIERMGCHSPPTGCGAPKVVRAPAVACLPTVPLQAPACTLTATAPPAGCCHPAPLHCDCCNGSGFFRASEAYGS